MRRCVVAGPRSSECLCSPLSTADCQAPVRIASFGTTPTAPVPESASTLPPHLQLSPRCVLRVEHNS